MWCVAPQCGLVLLEPPESSVSRPSSPLPPSPSLSIVFNSSDHHLNYPLSCPPDGIFANYNFSEDGQGIMTAEASAWGATGIQRGWLDVDVAVKFSFTTTCTRWYKHT